MFLPKKVNRRGHVVHIDTVNA